MTGKTAFLIALLLLPLGLAAGCSDPETTTPQPSPTLKALVSPTPSATQAAQDFKHDFPGARVFFSQNTGEILWIDGNGAALATGSTETAEQALNVVKAFMTRYPALYRISDLEQSLGATRSNDLKPDAGNQGVISLHFEELREGQPFHALHGVATFNTQGVLMSLQTHLLASVDIHTTRQNTSIPLSKMKVPKGALRLWTRTEPNGPFRLIEEYEERSGIRTLRTWRDPWTGETLRTSDESPSDLVTPPTGWASQAPSHVSGHDTLGNTLQIPSTFASGALVLGFSLPGIHKPGMAVKIGDAGGTDNPSQVPLTPIATQAADWLQEPIFDAKLRSASTLAINLETTFQWYKQNLNWSSWDGKGTTLFAGVRGNSSGTSTPELNAWGGSGMLMIGDGLTSTGQPLSDALDLVAHEFTHSVISATAALQYTGEAGALNESLADIFGKTVQGFPDVIEGSNAGAYFRDLADPEGCTAPDGHDCTQPGRYSHYRLIDASLDNGGVHTNSGIVNQALTQVIRLGSQDLGANSLALASLLLDALNFAGFDSALTLEDFASDIAAYCEARERADTLALSQTGLCARLETSFRKAELLSAPL